MLGLQYLINKLGDIKGYSRCPVTGDTFLWQEIIDVPYTNKDSAVIRISGRAIRKFDSEELAERIYTTSLEIDGKTPKHERHSIKKIEDEILRIKEEKSKFYGKTKDDDEEKKKIIK